MKKLLIVVDYQNDFVCGSLGFEGAEKLEETICKKLEQAKEEGWEIVFTMDTHQDNYLQTQEGRNLPVLHCIKDSEGWKLYGRVREYQDRAACCFFKGAFGSDALSEYVKKRDYQEIELCGLVSNICVLSNAVLVKAALPEAAVVIDAQCVAGFDPILHEKALDVMEGLQIIILNRDIPMDH